MTVAVNRWTVEVSMNFREMIASIRAKIKQRGEQVKEDQEELKRFGKKRAEATGILRDGNAAAVSGASGGRLGEVAMRKGGDKDAADNPVIQYLATEVERSRLDTEAWLERMRSNRAGGQEAAPPKKAGFFERILKGLGMKNG